MNIPCPTQITCPCDTTPLLGLSVEAPDVPNALAVRYAHILPNLGNTAWTQTFCIAAATAPDQATADLLAQRDANACVLEAQSGDGGGSGGGSGGAGAFFNAEQECTVTCPDGLPFTFTVPAGVFIASSQMSADSQAKAYACQQADIRVICLGALSPASAEQGLAYNGSITATGGSLGQNNNWAIVGGSIPPGLTFNGGTIPGNVVTITGTPTVIGTYNFTVEVTDPSGDTMTKPYSITVAICPIGEVITSNDGTWSQGPGSGGYDTGVFSSTMINQTQHITLQFFSSTAKTWRWHFHGTQPEVFPVTYLAFPTITINGVVQQGVIGTIENPITWDGTSESAGDQPINTNNCVPVTVDIKITSQPENPIPLNAIFQWQTPS